MIAALPLISSAVSSLLGGAQASSVTQSAKSVAPTGEDFSSMLARFSSDTVDKLNTSEQMSIAGISGKATTQSVVESVIAAQEALQTAVAVRDKAVSAFQEVTRMSI